jgi:polar amino acid transport system substrate-binding protein
MEGQINTLPTLDGGATLLVGLDDSPPAPIQIGSPQTDDFRGYEVDLLMELQRRLGVELRYRRALWSVMIGELASGELDIVCSAATVTEDRKREVDFCRPHLELFLAVVRRDEDASGIALRGARVGVRRGTTAEAHVRADGTAASTRLSESNDELYSALRDREIDAVVDDSPIAGYFSRRGPGLRVCGLVPGSDAAYAIMLRKGNAVLRNALDVALDDMASDGTLRAFRERWFDAGEVADT